MSKDAERLLKYIVAIAQEQNTETVLFNLLKVDGIPNIDISITKWLMELEKNELLSRYDISSDGGVTVYLTTDGIEYFEEKEANDNRIEKEKISVKKILSEKIIEVIVGICFAVCAKILQLPLSLDVDATIKVGIYILIPFFIVVCWVLAWVFWFTFIFDLVNIIRLLQKGKFVEFISKKDAISDIISIFDEGNNEKIERYVGKTYKNVDGEIYKIKSKRCACCKSEPIGKMYLIKKIRENRYMWVCHENSSHMEEFDYKNEF